MLKIVLTGQDAEKYLNYNSTPQQDYLTLQDKYRNLKDEYNALIQQFNEQQLTEEACLPSTLKRDIELSEALDKTDTPVNPFVKDTTILEVVEAVHKDRWTDRELDILVSHKRLNTLMLRLSNRSEKSIRSKLNRLGYQVKQGKIIKVS